MKTILAQKLKAILDEMSIEQIHQEWQEIVELGLEGPSLDDASMYLNEMRQNLVFENITLETEFSTTQYNCSFADVNHFSSNYNDKLNLAA